MISSTAQILNLGSRILKALARDGEACEILKLYTDFYRYVSGGISFFFQDGQSLYFIKFSEEFLAMKPT